MWNVTEYHALPLTTTNEIYRNALRGRFFFCVSFLAHSSSFLTHRRELMTNKSVLLFAECPTSVLLFVLPIFWRNNAIYRLKIIKVGRQDKKRDSSTEKKHNKARVAKIASFAFIFSLIYVLKKCPIVLPRAKLQFINLDLTPFITHFWRQGTRQGRVGQYHFVIGCY